MKRMKYIDAEAYKRDLIDNFNFYPALVNAALIRSPHIEVVCEDVPHENISSGKKIKNIGLAYVPGDECWVRGQDRVCYIDTVVLCNLPNGDIDVMYTWYNLDVGYDLTEVWDDGEFSPGDVGKTVFDTYEELEKAFPEEYIDLDVDNEQGD